MATITYPMVSRPAQQQSPAGQLATTSQNIQTSQNGSRFDSSTSSMQLAPSQANNNQMSLPQARTSSYQTSSPQLTSRTNQQPATPSQSLPPRKESPGAWRHPQADEIARRQRASTFGPDNVSVIAKTLTVVVLVQVLRWILPSFVWKLTIPIQQLTGSLPLYSLWLFATYTIFKAAKPLWLGPDQLLDIDLNATQRSLLGLDPNATPPATPATKYSTPPKYTRSVTPRDGTPGSRGSSPAGSPLAYKDGSYQRNDSLMSTRRASFGSDTRRQSFGLSNSVFGTPSKDGSVFAPQTPSPVGRASGIPFSNKWLYHKGGRSGSISKDSF